MIAHLQRVSYGAVMQEEALISEISDGVVMYVGFSNEDKVEYFPKFMQKIEQYIDNDEKWISKSLEVLIISQFTLLGKPKGTKITFHNAMNWEKAEEFFKHFVNLMKQKYTVKTGIFRSDMQIIQKVEKNDAQIITYDE